MKTEIIVEKFKQRIVDGKSIRYSDIKKEDSQLLFAMEKIGGVTGVAKLVGITQQELVDKYGLGRVILEPLSEKEALNRLHYLKSIGRLKTIAMRTEFQDLRLENYLKRNFGSVNKALEHYDLKRDGVSVTKKGLLFQAKKYSEEGTDMSYANMIKLDSKLVSNVNNKYKMSWYKFLDENKIPYIPLSRKFTRESVQQRIDDVRSINNGEINYALIRKYDVSLLNFVWGNYDSIYEFFVDFGLDAEKCVDMNTQRAKGFAFEKLFKEVLDLLKIEYKCNKYYNKDIRPDYQLDNGLWIDCKLSSWTSTIQSTIDKYTPECEKLIIVFLRGEEYHLDHIQHDKVEFRKMDYYYPFLRQVQRHDLIEEFEKIKYDNTESVTTERSTSHSEKKDEITV